MRIDSPKVSNLTFQDGAAVADSSFTGSFSGSFTGVGNFTGLTADSVEYVDVLNKPTLVSGSGQIDVTATANYVAPAISDVSGTPTLVSGITAAEVRTALGVDAAGTDNSTDVTLNTAGGPDYLTLTGQQINLGTIDISGDTNFAISDTTGQTGINLTLTDDTLSGTLVGLGTSATPTFGATTINGNITVSGTVDGRDVAADGTKLDGIDSSATNTADPAIESDGSSPSLATGITASEVRTLLSVDAAGTDNSTDVSLSGTPDYITISGQTITRNQIDLTTDVTGDLPISEGGTGASTAAAARTNLGVDAAGTDNSTDVTLAGSRDYLTISGQEITVGQIDISDDTNLAVSDTSGQTGINMSLTGDTLSGVVSGLTTTSNVQFANLTLSGDLTVNGDTVSLNATNLEVEDKLISVNRGGTTAASANGAGLHISGANETLTWDNGNSRFTFSDDLNVGGNITLSGTVDGRDLATDGSKLDGIEANATADQTDAQIETAYNNQVAQVSSSERTAGTSTTIKRFAPADIKSMIDTHETNTQLSDSQVRSKISGTGLISYNNSTGVISTTATSNTGTVTSVTVGTGLDVSNGTTTPSITLDLSELTDMTADVVGANDELILLDSGAERKKAINEIKLSQFNNDSGFLTAHPSISAASSVNNSGRTYIQDITLDSNGHVTALTSATETVTDTTYSADGNYGLTLSGTTFRLENDRRRNSNTTDIYSGNTHDYTFYDASVGIRWYTAGAEDMRLTDAGDLHVDGNVTAYSSTISDERLKDNVSTIENALDKVENLRGVEYDWNAGSKQGKHDLGFIAQEVESVLPDLVIEQELPFVDGGEYKTLDYEKITAVLVEAVKELSARVKELENK